MTQTDSSATEPANTGTVSRALQLLTILADAGEPVTVKAVSHKMGVAPSTAHRLLNLLRQEGFVEVAGSAGYYGVGAAFFRVAARVVDSVSVPRLAQPLLDDVAAAFNETVMLSWYVPSEGAMSFIARADGGQKLQYRIDLNTSMSLLWGASGKAILAYLPQDAVIDLYERGAASPAASVALPPFEQLCTELDLIRRQGFAVTVGEKLPDARGVAAPVFNARGVAGCFCLTSPASRMPEAGIDAVSRKVVEKANELSSVLGYAGGEKIV